MSAQLAACGKKETEEEKMMRYPNPLKENGTIGFVAPSFGCGIEPYRTKFVYAQKVFAARGHGLDLGPNCYEEKGIGISNTPEACGSELTEWYCRKENDVLISCGGGELMCEILDFVDFDRIRAAAPKWYMGFSDNTNFTFLLPTLCDTASIYGPCAAAFGMEPWDTSLEDAYQMLRGKKDRVKGYPLWEKAEMSIRESENPLAPYRLTELKTLKTYIGQRPAEKTEEITFQGRLIGGCMDCLVNLAGTCYDKVVPFAERYRDDGLIWFLESCDLTVMEMRRAIWEMKHAGWFSHIKGVLVGRPLYFGEEMMGLDQYRAVTDLLAEYQIPMVMDVDFGHLPPMMPLMCGAAGKVRVKGNDIEIQYLKK